MLNTARQLTTDIYDTLTHVPVMHAGRNTRGIEEVRGVFKNHNFCESIVCPLFMFFFLLL